MHFAEGNAAAAAKLLGRTLADNGWSCRSKRGQALAWHAIIAAHAGRLEEARAALLTLRQEPELVSTPALQALAARARGEVAAAGGRRGEAITALRDSLRLWQGMQAAVAAAQVRCRLADLLDEEGETETATLERTAAFTAFEQAGAQACIRACQKLSGVRAARRAGSRPRTPAGR